jgi:MFS transporter, PPP family, 3-phenylpropionic acid transporter
VVISLLAVVASVWWMPEQTHAAPSAQQGSGLSVWQVVNQAVVRWLFAAVFWHVIAHVAMYAFFSLYMDHLGYSKTVIGLLWSVAVVWEVGWFLFQGHWLPRLHLASWLLLAAGLTAVRMGITAAGATSLLVLLVAQALHAITFAAHHTVCIALIHQHFPAALRGRGQALYAVVGYGLTGVIAGAGGGWVVDRLGLAWIFWLSAVAGLMATYCAWRFKSIGT